MDMKDIEKYSSAYTLSDMEIFVFPELMYSLVLANIMSPVLWKWRELESFRKLDGKGSYRRLMRLRQFIMDEFDFNLDLETWGLTDQQYRAEAVRAVPVAAADRPEQRPVRLRGRQVLLRRRYPQALRAGQVHQRHHPVLEDRDRRGDGRLPAQAGLRPGGGGVRVPGGPLRRGGLRRGAASRSKTST